jgi:PAS domain S-box-containing protein
MAGSELVEAPVPARPVIRYSNPMDHALTLGGQGFTILSRLSTRLLTTHTSETLTRVFQDLSESLGLEVYFNYELVDDGSTLRLQSYRGVSEEAAERLQSLASGEAICGQVAKDREHVILEEVQCSDDPKSHLIRDLGIQAYAAFPLIGHGQLLGTLSFGSRRFTKFDEEELQLLRAVSTLIALSIEREKQLARLRDQAELLDLAHDTFIVRNLEGVISFWNRGAERMYGWTRGEATGQVGHRLLQTQFPKPLEHIEADLQRRGTWEGELIHTNRDGKAVIVHSRWAVQRSEAGQQLGVLEVNHDVTDRKNVEKGYQQAITDLQGSRLQLQEKIDELERFEDAVIGRELKMIDLERQVTELRHHVERLKRTS